MNPGIGLLWICIGAAVGWFGSKIMSTFARPSALANISIGILGALVVGFITGKLVGANLGYAGAIAGLGGAMLGSCLLVFGWQTLSRPRL